MIIRARPAGRLAIATELRTSSRRASRARVYRLPAPPPTIAIGGALLLLLILIAIFAPYLGTVDPSALSPARRTRAPSAQYWFGTDMLGRDIYSRVLYGTASR